MSPEPGYYDDEVVLDVREPAQFQSEDAGKTEGLQRVHVGEPLYFEIVEWIEDEASRLDDNQLMEWFGLMTMDLSYRMPVRLTKERADGSEFSDTMFHFDEDIMSLGTKVTRLAKTQTAWAEKPPSRTRRFVTNIKVFRLPSGGDEEEYEVRSSLLLIRNRYQESERRSTEL
jgi:3-phenylpropionate/cinnamic acid dioxygenase small subunit